MLWTEQHELSNAAYNRLGGLERALDRHADMIYESFPPEDQPALHAILLALVRPGLGNEYTRRRVRRDDLLAKPELRERMAAVIQGLSDLRSRLVSEQQISGTLFLELTHEILLRQWNRLRVLIDVHKNRLQSREALLPYAEQWEQSKLRTQGRGDASHLYRGALLRQARAYTGVQEFQEEVDSGILACYQASLRRQRRERATALIAATALLVLIYAGFQWFTADAQRRLQAEQAVSSQRATAQVQSQQTAQAEAVQRSTAEANAAQESERAQREAKVSNSQRLANLSRQLLQQGNRPLAIALALEAASIENPPLAVEVALAEVAYAPGFARMLSPQPAIPENERCVVATAAGRRVIQVDMDGTFLKFTLFDIDNKRSLRSTRLDAGLGVVLNDACMPISADGRYALIGVILPMVPISDKPVDGTLVLWDLEANTQLRTFEKYAGNAAFAPQSNRFVYAAIDDTLQIWHPEGTQGTVISGARAPLFWNNQSNAIVAAGLEQDTVLVFTVEPEINEYVRWNGAGIPAGFSADGNSVYIEHNGLSEWSLGNAAQMSGLRGRIADIPNSIVGVESIAVSASGERLYYYEAGTDGGGIVMSAANDFNTLTTPTYPENVGGPTFIFPAFSTDGQVAISAETSGLYQINMNQGTAAKLQLPIQFSIPRVLALNNDGSLLAHLNEQGIMITKLNNLQEQTFIRLTDRNVLDTKFSPDGQLLLALHSNMEARPGSEGALQLSVWSTADGQQRVKHSLDVSTSLAHMRDLEAQQREARWSADGSHIAVCVTGGSCSYIETVSGKLLWSIPAPGGLVAIHPDGKMLAVGEYGGGQVQLLDSTTGSVMTSLVGAVGPFAFAPDGSTIATASIDTTLRVFSSADGTEIRRFHHDTTVKRLIFAPDGHSILTGTALQGVKQWRMDSLPELITWTNANRQASPLTCEQRVLYQVPPLCPPSSTATPDPLATPLPQQRATPILANTPAPAPTVTASGSTTEVRITPVSISASGEAPASKDASGNTVTYAAKNIFDGDPSTAWRIAGDGVGATLTLDFGREVEITGLEILPGYAKIDQANNINRFIQNRRIKRVQISAGVLQQEASLQDRPELQRIDLDGKVVRAQILIITILETSPAGTNDPRDFTPISEIAVFGVNE